MATDPRKYLNTDSFSVASCDKGQVIQQQDASSRKDFFNSLNNLGNLEILNDVGFGTVAEGLRTLVSTSNSIRTGTKSPSSLGSDANGVNYVFNSTGINANAAQQILSFNPNVANRAYGQARSIYEKVKQGNFELSDIPETFSDLQNLATLIDGIYTDPKSNEPRQHAMCGASPYAVDLISYAPKYKFLFVVEFEFTTPYADQFKDIRAAFVVKNSTRPNINFEYEEVNMYNFWTRIPKRTIYEPVTMRFYDDNRNQAMLLYNAYLKAMSPIANMSFDQSSAAVRGTLESQSMDYEKMYTSNANGAPSHAYAASLGPTAGRDTMNIFKKITLYQVYNAGRSMNVYKFYNPKILTMELDDVDMADNGNGNELSFQFAYDSLHIDTGYDVSRDTILADASGKQYNATYYLQYVGNGGSSSDLNSPSAQDQAALSSSRQQAQVAAGAIPGSLDSARDLVSSAFNAASNYIGSTFS